MKVIKSQTYGEWHEIGKYFTKYDGKFWECQNPRMFRDWQEMELKEICEEDKKYFSERNHFIK